MPRTTHHFLPMLVALATLISPVPAPADAASMIVPGIGVTVVETEDNDRDSVADLLHLGDNAAGVIDPGGESDFYRFVARAGVTIRAETRPGTVYDLTLTLYDTDGTTILQCDDDDGPGAAARLKFLAPTDGTYFLEVKAFLSLQAGTYTLRLRVVERTDRENHWRKPLR